MLLDDPVCTQAPHKADFRWEFGRDRKQATSPVSSTTPTSVTQTPKIAPKLSTRRNRSRPYLIVATVFSSEGEDELDFSYYTRPGYFENNLKKRNTKITTEKDIFTDIEPKQTNCSTENCD